MLPENNLGQTLKVQQHEIADGVNGNIQTIEMMRKAARIRAGDPLIRKLALNILQEYQVPSHYFVDEALAIGDYVQKNIRYVRDPDDIEYLQDPLAMLKSIQNQTAQGDCDDMALFAATLLLSVGHQPAFRAVRYEQGYGNFNHIYVIVHERNPHNEIIRVVLDCIVKDKPMGYEIPHQSGEDYPV